MKTPPAKSSKSAAITNIGDKPVVVIPLEEWRKIEDALENLEALSSPRFLKSVADGREEAARGEVVPFESILKKYG